MIVFRIARVAWRHSGGGLVPWMTWQRARRMQGRSNREIVREAR